MVKQRARAELFVPNAAGRIYPSVPRGGGDTHNHYLQFAPQIDALDGVSVDRVLREHAKVFAKHVEDHMRKQNRTRSFLAWSSSTKSKCAQQPPDYAS